MTEEMKKLNVIMAITSWGLNYAPPRAWWQRFLGLRKPRTRKQLDEMYDRAYHRWKAKN